MLSTLLSFWFQASIEKLKEENREYLAVVKQRWIEDQWSRTSVLKDGVKDFVSKWWKVGGVWIVYFVTLFNILIDCLIDCISAGLPCLIYCVIYLQNRFPRVRNYPQAYKQVSSISLSPSEHQVKLQYVKTLLSDVSYCYSILAVFLQS